MKRLNDCRLPYGSHRSGGSVTMYTLIRLGGKEITVLHDITEQPFLS